jgi:hypothetical protein
MGRFGIYIPLRLRTGNAGLKGFSPAKRTLKALGEHCRRHRPDSLKEQHAALRRRRAHSSVMCRS